MESKEEKYEIRYKRYFVTDNEGKKHLYLDRLAAQIAEDDYKRKERENKNDTPTPSVHR